MLTVDTIGKVRRAHFVQGKKIKAIAREMNLARNTVREIIRAEAQTEHRYVRKDQPLPQLGDHVAALDAMLKANTTCSRRERLTYYRMYEELRLGGAIRAATMLYGATGGRGLSAKANGRQRRLCR